MTNELSTERAIEALYTVRAYYASLTAGYPKGKDCRGIGDVMCSEIANSCLMAINALELVNDFETAQIITGGRLNGRAYAYKCGLADGQRLAKSEKIFNILPLEQQPSEDCISRSDVMVLIEDTNLKHLSFKRGISQKAFEDLLNGTQSLPSVIPQPKIGHWIIEEVKDEDGRPYDIKYFCSECQAERPPIWDDYCSACGAKMEVEDKESEE